MRLAAWITDTKMCLCDRQRQKGMSSVS